MPNWVKNKIMVGRKDIITRLKEKYCFLSKETNNLEFDFNKVIKMPHDLEIEFSTKSDKALVLYMTFIDPEVKYYGKEEDKVSKKDWIKFYNLIKDHMLINRNLTANKDELKEILNSYKDEENKLLNLGKLQINNILNYNAINWYEWSIDNWGCKWNASNLKIKEDEKIILFDTPWAPPIPVMLEVSKQNPDVKIALLYSDEEIGCHVGYLLMKDGHIDFEGTFDDRSVDAYKLAFDIWEVGNDYVWDDERNTYIRKEQKWINRNYRVT